MNQDRSTTITNFQLKEGYKQTEVGIIPEDWSATNLGKFMMLQRGYDLPHRERKIGDIPIITSSGFGGTHSESRALAPGVVTGRYGTIGDVFYVQEDFWPLNTTLYVKNFYGNNPLFTSYLLKTIDFHSHSGKSGVPGVNRNDLHELIVRIPPLAEQEAIAYTLSDIDALIESLDRLLTKKRQIKH
jgi:type I restriction enzyme, S subunit